MEPVLGGRDDLAGGAAAVSSVNLPTIAYRLPSWVRPQWSPSLADGTTQAGRERRAAIARPQWSPSLADGTTRVIRVLHEDQLLAAMEPVLGGRDDSAVV